ncbi:MAG: LCP family protein [Nocardioides sp.]|jgi:LCP family protein required for cell wall assembly
MAEPRRHPRLRRLTYVGLALVLIAGAGLGYLYLHLNGNLDRREVGKELGADRPDAVAVEGPKKPVNILVMASDDRSCEGCGIDGEAGMGGSDTTILLHLSADRSRAYAVSIPRDSIVTRPDCGADDQIAGGTGQMWNEAFRLGGEGCTWRQVEALTGVRIDNYVTFNFGSFKSMVAALDGVPVCIPQDIDDDTANIHLKAGTRELNPDESLQYVRLRYWGPIEKRNDLSRIRRQQEFIAAMLNKASHNVARPDRILPFLDAATESIATDFDNLRELAGLAMDVRKIGMDQVRLFTIPNEYFPSDSEFAGKVRWKPAADEIWERIAADEAIPTHLIRGSVTADPDRPKNLTPEEKQDRAEMGICS